MSEKRQFLMTLSGKAHTQAHAEHIARYVAKTQVSGGLRVASVLFDPDEDITVNDQGFIEYPGHDDIDGEYAEIEINVAGIVDTLLEQMDKTVESVFMRAAARDAERRQAEAAERLRAERETDPMTRIRRRLLGVGADFIDALADGLGASIEDAKKAQAKEDVKTTDDEDEVYDMDWKVIP